MTAIEKLEKTNLSVNLISDLRDINVEKLKTVIMFNNLRFVRFVTVTEYVDISLKIIENGFDKYKFINVDDKHALLIDIDHFKDRTLILASNARKVHDMREFVNKNNEIFYNAYFNRYTVNWREYGND